MKSKKLTTIQRIAQLEQLFAQSVHTITTLSRALSELQQYNFPDRFKSKEPKVEAHSDLPKIVERNA